MSEYLYTPNDIARYFLWADFTNNDEREILKDIWDCRVKCLNMNSRKSQKLFYRSVYSEIDKYEDLKNDNEITDINKILEDIGSSFLISDALNEERVVEAFFRIAKLKLCYTQGTTYIKLKLRTLLKTFGYKRRSEQLVNSIKITLKNLDLQTFLKGNVNCNINEIDLDDIVMIKLNENRSGDIPIANKYDIPERNTLNQKRKIQYYKDNYYIGISTKNEIAPFLINLSFFLMNDNEIIEEIKGYGCEIIKDFGIVNARARIKSDFRKLLVKDRLENEQWVYFNVMSLYNDKFGYERSHTVLVCGIQSGVKNESILQLNLDEFVQEFSTGYNIYHNGTRVRKKRQDTIDYVKSLYPSMVKGNMIDLGWLDDSDNISIEDIHTKDFMARLVTYVLLRNELALNG